MLDPRGVTLFDALQAFFQEHQCLRRSRQRRRGRPRLDDVYVQVTRALDLAVSGGRSVEPGAEPDEFNEEERTTEAEQNGACDDHIPKHCLTLGAEQAQSTRRARTYHLFRYEATVKSPYCLTRYDDRGTRRGTR